MKHCKIMEKILKMIKIELDKNKNRVFGIKSPIIWAYEDNISYPIAYLKKPKYLTQKEFEDILDKIEIKIN